MDKQQRIDLIVFSRTLLTLRVWMDNPRDITSEGQIHEDDPPAKHSGQAGIDGLREFKRQINDLKEKAKPWPNNAVSRRVREWLTLVTEAIAQADTWAEMELLDGNETGARRICRQTMKLVRRLCYFEMMRIEAALLVASSMGWPGESDTNQETITAEEISPQLALTETAKALLSLVSAMKRRLTKDEILCELERRETIIGESTVKNALAELTRLKVLDNRRNSTPPGYGLPDWN